MFTGWTLNGGFTANSGTPLTALLGGNLQNSRGTGGGRAMRAEATGLAIAAVATTSSTSLAFTSPLGGQYGNAGRNTIPGLVRRCA